MLETLSGATRVYPVVGDPIAQVKSPFGITHALSSQGIDAICIPAQIAPADFDLYVRSIRATRNVDGLIVTVPHKFAAFDVCDSVSERAAFLQTVNVIRKLQDGGLHGDMFDGLGFVEACQTHGCDFKGRRALLVGAGGAGTAIAHAVSTAGVAELSLCDVDVRRRDELASRLSAVGFNVTAAENDPLGYDIVLNATPLGMRAGDPTPVPLRSLRAGQFVGDVVTKPEITPLIAEARRLGLKTSNGVAMFEKVRDLLLAFLLDGAETAEMT